MTIRSAGLLVFRRVGTKSQSGAGDDHLEVLLGHPGGPLYRSKTKETWSIPKGLIEPNESAFETARREFVEETGVGDLPSATDSYVPLGSVRYRNGKWVEAWGLELEVDPNDLHSNEFTMVWPPRSGRLQSFPEVDCFSYFDLRQARQRILPAQIPFLDRLIDALAEDGSFDENAGSESSQAVEVAVRAAEP